MFFNGRQIGKPQGQSGSAGPSEATSLPWQVWRRVEEFNTKGAKGRHESCNAYLTRRKLQRRRLMSEIRGCLAIPARWPRHESFRDKSIKNKTLFYWCQRNAIRIREITLDYILQQTSHVRGEIFVFWFHQYRYDCALTTSKNLACSGLLRAIHG